MDASPISPAQDTRAGDNRWRSPSGNIRAGSGGAQRWGSRPYPVWTSLAHSTGFSIAAAYVLRTNCVQKVGSPRTAFHSNLLPSDQVLTWFAFLRVTILGLQIAGDTVILAGIALTRLK